MKVEIEIDVGAVKNYIQKYVDQSISGSYVYTDLRRLVEEQTKKCLDKAFINAGFLDIIEKTCREVAIKEIEKSATKKVPGWVQQQMKEMLKYAHASFWKKDTNPIEE